MEPIRVSSTVDVIITPIPTPHTGCVACVRKYKPTCGQKNNHSLRTTQMTSPYVKPVHPFGTTLQVERMVHEWIKRQLAYVQVPLRMGIATLMTFIAWLWCWLVVRLLRGYHPLYEIFLRLIMDARGMYRWRWCRHLFILIPPASRIRRWVLWVPRVTARCILFCLGFYWIPVKGSCAERHQAPIIVSNHVSMWEALFLFWHTGATPLSRKENADIPSMAPLLELTQAIMVDRTLKSSRSAAVSAIVSNVMHGDWEAYELAAKPSMLVFPEGTTTHGNVLAPFYVGAFAAGRPIQPVIVKYDWKWHNPAWTRDDTGGILAILARMYKQYVNWMRVEYLPVYVPSREEVDNPMVFASNVQRVMANALGVPISDEVSPEASGRHFGNTSAVPLASKCNN